MFQSLIVKKCLPLSLPLKPTSLLISFYPCSVGCPCVITLHTVIIQLMVNAVFNPLITHYGLFRCDLSFGVSTLFHSELMICLAVIKLCIYSLSCCSCAPPPSPPKLLCDFRGNGIKPTIILIPSKDKCFDKFLSFKFL